tara:strand:- start:98 stop:502 length:405 start_codon:yes stop_codon:yes gene_type:complete
MSRIDDPTLYNPFGWRLADLADPSLAEERRRELSEELLVWEATEVAHGYRHLTVVHGPADNVADSHDLDAFYDTIRVVTGRAGWARVRGTDGFVTVTVQGPAADATVEQLSTAACAAGRGRWEIAPTAYPRPAC